MKKVFIFVAILLATATTITIVSCKKDKENEKNNTENPLMKYELSEMDKAMMAFGEKLKTAGQEKSGETMPLVEALTTLSNYQNFSLCDASYYSTDMTVDTFKVSLGVTNGEVSLNDLSDFYDITQTLILSRLASISGDQKAVYSIWSSIAEGSRDDTDGYTGSIDVDVVTRMRGGIDSGNLSVFGPTDYWCDFDSLGQCDIYEGQNVGRDCVTELNYKMAYYISIPNCGTGYRRYLTNQETETSYSLDYPDSLSPNGYYALPWRSFWDDPQCVSPSEMNYYLQALTSICSDYETASSKYCVGHLLTQTLHLRDHNYNHEAVLVIQLADVNCVPVIDD
jgi:hypothetical protein